MPRIPLTCPENLAGRYTVKSGDTMYEIASKYSISLDELVKGNPHIPNPNIIFPGDILCVPGQVIAPCCVVLQPVNSLELGEVGVAVAYTSFVGNLAVSVMAVLSTLPPGFDMWAAEVDIPGVGSFRNPIYPTPQTPPTFSGTIFLPEGITIVPNSVVRVFPTNTTMGIVGPIKMAGTLNECD